MITIVLPDKAQMLTDDALIKLVRKSLLAKSNEYYIADEIFLNEFFSPKCSMFLERLCYQHNITIEQLREMAEDCIFEWIATDKMAHRNYSEAASHLTSHLRIKLKNIKYENNRRTTKDNRDTDFGNYIKQQLNAMPTTTNISRQLSTNIQSE